MQKLLSVAIPSYNSQDYVSRAIESLLPGREQVEIIVVDDGNDEENRAYISSVEKNYPLVTVVTRSKNGGK